MDKIEHVFSEQKAGVVGARDAVFRKRMPAAFRRNQQIVFSGNGEEGAVEQPGARSRRAAASNCRARGRPRSPWRNTMTTRPITATTPRSRPSSVVSIEARSQQNSGYLAVTRSVKRTAAAHFVEPARISSAARVPRGRRRGLRGIGAGQRAGGERISCGRISTPDMKQICRLHDRDVARPRTPHHT